MWQPEFKLGSSLPLLDTLIERLADPVVVITDDGVIGYANPAANALFGRRAGQLLGTRFEYPLRDGEIEIVRDPADIRVGDVRVRAVEWDGAPAHLAVIRDVTSRKQRADYEREYAAFDKRAWIEQVAASVAHEINNPAAFMLTNLAVMRDVLDEFEAAFREARVDRATLGKYPVARSLAEMREMLDDNEQGLARIRLFIRDLEATARVDRDAIHVVDVDEAVSVACELGQKSRPRGVKLLCDARSRATVAGDRRGLVVIVVNLIDNAARAVAERGSVTVSAASVGDTVVITVADDGCGIPADCHKRIFEPFYAGWPGTPSLGLGLPLARELASDLGARLEVTSDPGAGSAFRLTVPRVGTSPPARRPHAGRDPASAPGSVRARVLLIHDDRATARRLCEILAPSHDVVDAGGSDAVVAHLDRDSDYDVILFDVTSSHAGALELYRRVAATRPQLAARMVFLGPAEASKPVLESVRAIVLEQPVSPALLSEVIERVGG